MDFNAFPEEILQEIFSQLDFARQCQLRRTCRRWTRLLQSEDVLRNMIFDVPGWSTLPWRARGKDLLQLTGCVVKKPLLTECIGKATPFNRHVLFIRSFKKHPRILNSFGEVANPDQWALVCFVLEVFQNKNDLERQVLFQNLCPDGFFYLNFVGFFKVLRFRNVFFDRCGCYLWPTGMEPDNFESDSLSFHVIDSSIPNNNDVTQLDVFRRLARENIKESAISEKTENLKMKLFSKFKVQPIKINFLIRWLLDKYQPDFDLTKQPPNSLELKNLEIENFLSIVRRILAAWESDRIESQTS